MGGDRLAELSESVAAQASALAALQATLNEFMENINSKFASVTKGIEDLKADVSFIKRSIHGDGPTHQNSKVPKSNPFLGDHKPNNKVKNSHLSEMAEPKCQKMGRCSSNVPEEVVEEIFSWLPPESLIRFKSVCKSWYSLITSLFNNPDFVAKHLHNAHNNILSPTPLLILDHYDSDDECLDNSSSSEDSILLLNISSGDGEKDSIHFVVEELELPSPLGEDYKNEQELPIIIEHISKAEFSHYDGIICLVYFDEIILWNPALRESKLLSEPDVATYSYLTEVCKSGFGYDPILNDYKVLKISPRKIFLIYSLKTNTWRDITKCFREDEYHLNMDDTMQICFKGICYWFLFGKKYMVLSFDLHAEEFCAIPLPVQVEMIFGSTLKVWNDSIAFVSSFIHGWSTRPIEMWVMKYCSEVVSDSSFWIKYLSIVPFVGRPLTFWKNDELLLKDRDEFFSYNLRTEKLRKLVLQKNINVNRTLLFWGSYVKSLISVNR